MRAQKYFEEIESLVDETPKSTRQIMIQLHKKLNRNIGWQGVYIKLKRLEEKGFVKSFENDTGIFWVKK